MSEQAKFRDLLNVYSFTCELPGTGEEIEFKPVTTGQLKKLLTYENEKNPVLQELAIDELLNSCIITEDYNIDTMFLEDRFYFLVQVRKKSKGELIEFQYDCEKCKSQSLIKISLDDLPIIHRKEDEDSIVELNNGLKLKLKHVTRGDQKQIKPNVFKGLTESQQSAELQIISTALGIESVVSKEFGEETEIPLKDKKFLVENIPTGEFEKIMDWYGDNFFGIDFTYQIGCVHCGFSKTIDIPMEHAFFF